MRKSSMLHRSFKPDKCKITLRMAVSRLKLMRNKKEVQVNQLKREIAQLLQSGNDASARIKVEHVVREEKMMAAYELISLYSELVMTRLPIIESQKNCPIDLKEAITSLVFATPRCGDIPELVDVQKHFTAKYGKDFVTTAIELRPDCGVSRLLVEKLSAKAPDGQTKLKILTAIAEEHSIKWDPKSFGENDLTATTDFLSGPASIQAVSEHIQSPLHPPPQTPQTFPASVVHAQSPRQEPSPVSHNQVHNQPLNPEHKEGRSMSSYSQHEAKRFDPGVDTEGLAGEQSFSEDRNTSLSHGHNWNMDFKDAASAAQAAAESAARANMAARAAAEFASRDGMKRPYYTESHQSGSHSKRDSSEFAELPEHSSDSYAFDRHCRSDSDLPEGVKFKNPGGNPEKSYHDGPFGDSSLDVGKYSQNSTYEEEAEKPDNSIKPQYDESEYRSDVRETSDYEDFHHIKTVDSVKGSDTTSNWQPNNYNENSDASDSDHQSHKSHTGYESQFGMEQGRIHSDISRTGSGNSAFAVFDKADSDHEDIYAGPKYDDQDSDSDSIPSGKAAPSNIFITTGPQDFGFSDSKSLEKSVFKQSSIPGKHSSYESPVITETPVNELKFDDQLPTKFDDSNGPSSEDENIRDEKPQLKSTVDESDDEILTQTSSELGNTLNFGNLTGGLRQKRHALPQYRNTQVDDVTASLENSVEGSSSRMFDSTASTKTQGQVDTEVKEITKKKNLGFSHDDSDIDSSEDEGPAQGSGFGREPYPQQQVKHTGTNSRSKVAVPYFESDSDEVPRSSKQTSRKDMSSGLSRRTKGTPASPARNPIVQPKGGESKSSDFSSGRKSAYGSSDSRSNNEPESHPRRDTPSTPVTNKLQSKLEESDYSEYSSVDSRFYEEPEFELSRAFSPGNHKDQPTRKGTNDSDSSSRRKSTFSSHGSQFTEETESPRRSAGQPRNSEISSAFKKSPEQIPESKVSSHHESLIPAEQPDIFQQKEKTSTTSHTSQATGNVPSELDSDKQPSHVHPKLPDYDSFAAFFKK